MTIFEEEGCGGWLWRGEKGVARDVYATNGQRKMDGDWGGGGVCEKRESRGWMETKTSQYEIDGRGKMDNKLTTHFYFFF